ncbi:MAG TPA: SemiSWEET family transporter [archaeon]|nr:SemiSWEET family transporter [archaeon]
MAFIDILAIVVTIVGLSMSLSYIPQAYRIVKRKSSHDISIVTYIILLVGFATWLIYGLVINNMPLILTNSVSLLAGSSVLVATFVYRKHRR